MIKPPEPTKDQLFAMLKLNLEVYSNLEQTKATDNVLRKIIKLTDHFVQPRAAYALLGQALANVKFGKEFDSELVTKLFTRIKLTLDKQKS